MTRLSTWLLVLPAAVAAIVLAIANRHTVRLSFDPFSSEAPFYWMEMQLWIFLFAFTAIGFVLGAGVMWFVQGRHRRRAWEEFRHARELERELDKERKAHDEDVRAAQTTQGAQ